MTIGDANREALRRIQAGKAALVGLATAREVVPGLRDRVVLHAGPPIGWDRMCGPMRGAVIGASLFEGWARTPEDAVRLAESGGLAFDSCHHHRAVGPMAGIITAATSTTPSGATRRSTWGRARSSGWALTTPPCSSA